MSLVWSVREEFTTPYNNRSRSNLFQIYWDRSINEKDFDKIVKVKDQTTEMIEYMRNFKRIQKAEYNIHDMLIAFNNHFAGFGPQSVNDFLKIMNKSEKSWKNDLESRQQYNSDSPQ